MPLQFECYIVFFYFVVFNDNGVNKLVSKNIDISHTDGNASHQNLCTF